MVLSDLCERLRCTYVFESLIMIMIHLTSWRAFNIYRVHDPPIGNMGSWVYHYNWGIKEKHRVSVPK